ncbi:hypothetical protein [Maridesulfovibrio frigidus]|uniref:hypothetical protein n=1 Tax=Maridesulfovibrio frigidus TaxID=340956 RepID=UPI0004E159D2|nr:hypothetical protein [Maridesulfovibrio frigidus]
MLRQNDYILQRKKWEDLNSSLRMYGTSEPPEMQLENMWEVVSRSTGEKLEMVEVDFSEFSSSDRMYPSMMKPEVKRRWDMKKQEWEDQLDRYKRIERMARAEFLLDNPDLPVAQDLAKTNYGKELVSEHSHGAVQRSRTMELDTRRVSNPETHILKEDSGKLSNNIERFSSKVDLDNLEGAEYYWTVEPSSGACDHCQNRGGVVFRADPGPAHPNCRCKIKKHAVLPRKDDGYKHKDRAGRLKKALQPKLDHWGRVHNRWPGKESVYIYPIQKAGEYMKRNK